MGKWKEVKLSEVYDVRDGTHDSPKYVQEGYPLVTSKNLKGNSVDLSNVKYISQDDYDAINKRSKVDIGDVLFAMIGTIGNPILIEEAPNYAIKNVALFKKKDLNQDSKFLTYYLGSERILDKMKSEAKGATQKFVGLTYLRNFKIPLPPLPEQQRIVTKLDGLFAKIDQAISLLEANLQHTQALMGSVLDEEFGKLEAKYGKIELASLCDKITDGSHHSPKTIEKGFPYVTVKDVTWEGKIDTVHCKKISKSDFEELEKNGCKPILGDVLLSKDGTVGKVAIVDFDMDWVVLSSLAIIRPNKSKLDTTFLSWMLKTPIIQELAIGLKTGAAIKRIVLRTIKKIEIPIPSDLKEQKRISDYFEKLNSPYQTLLETQTQKLNHLKALKSSLLDQAFKGEL